MKTERFSRGIAFIVEGATESVFYSEFLQYCASTAHLLIDEVQDGDGINYALTKPDGAIDLIKFHSVGTVSQMTNSADWFSRSCLARHSSVAWSVILGYDTDDYNCTITKFHEGDWARLRKNLSIHTKAILDLAAAADIEDIMLCDYAGVLSFLGLPQDTECPSGRKGKVKMKKLYRLKKLNNAYKSGERSRALIQSLNWELIVRNAPIDLRALREILIGDF